MVIQIFFFYYRKGAPSTPLASIATTKIVASVLEKNGLPGNFKCTFPRIKLSAKEEIYHAVFGNIKNLNPLRSLGKLFQVQFHLYARVEQMLVRYVDRLHYINHLQ